MSEDDEDGRAPGGTGFLSRWSRRKRAAVTPAPDPAAEAPAAAAPPAVAPEPAEPFDPASLPPIESLTAESDITAFLRPQVPAALRTAALRRAWMLDPAIRDYVGPADYAWDYNAPDGMAGFSLELGGDVKRLLAQAIGMVEEAPKPAEAAAPGPEEPEAAPAPAEPSPTLVAEATPPDPAAPDPGPPAEGAAPAVSTRRHGSARPV